MSLRPAVPGRHGHRPHRYEAVAHRSVQARINGEWIAATVTGRMQPREGGAWEICLEYAQAPGENVVGWFVEDPAYLRADDTGEEGTPKIDQVPDAIPPRLIELQRAVHRAQAAIRAYAAAHPRVLSDDEAREWDRLHRIAQEAALALYAHPDKASVGWQELMEAARREDPAGSD